MYSEFMMHGQRNFKLMGNLQQYADTITYCLKVSNADDDWYIKSNRKDFLKDISAKGGGGFLANITNYQSFFTIMSNTEPWLVFLKYLPLYIELLVRETCLPSHHS